MYISKIKIRNLLKQMILEGTKADKYFSEYAPDFKEKIFTGHKNNYRYKIIDIPDSVLTADAGFLNPDDILGIKVKEITSKKEFLLKNIKKSGKHPLVQNIVFYLNDIMLNEEEYDPDYYNKIEAESSDVPDLSDDFEFDEPDESELDMSVFDDPLLDDPDYRPSVKKKSSRSTRDKEIQQGYGINKKQKRQSQNPGQDSDDEYILDDEDWGQYYDKADPKPKKNPPQKKTTKKKQTATNNTSITTSKTTIKQDSGNIVIKIGTDTAILQITNKGYLKITSGGNSHKYEIQDNSLQNAKVKITSIDYNPDIKTNLMNINAKGSAFGITKSDTITLSDVKLSDLFSEYKKANGNNFSFKHNKKQANFLKR